MTSMMATGVVETVREHLVRALYTAADFNSADVVGPSAVLWTDADGAWGGVVSALRSDLTIVALGGFAPEQMIGPVPWLRLQVADYGKASSSSGPLVVYLPGVSRKDLNDPSELPQDLQPLAGLVHLCTFFSQRNGSDWTPSAFMSNEVHGLGLALAGSKETKEALVRAFPRLLDTQVRDLKGRTLESSDFDKLLVDDPPRQLLLWMNNPDGYQADLEAKGEWDGFVSLARQQYKMDLLGDGVLRAGQLLGELEGKWAEVWNRFTDAPQTYPQVVGALRAGKPDDVMISLHPDSWPQDNEQAEEEAFAALSSMTGAPIGEVRTRLTQLREDHAHRLDTVWAKLQLTPAAVLIERLGALATATSTVGVGSEPASLAGQYASDGWRADAAFVAALSALELGHPSALVAEEIAEALYRPWLEETVRQFQNVWLTSPPIGREPGVSLDEPQGTCVVFVDGLRFDVAADLADALEERGLDSDLQWGLAGVPSVTATCKYAVSPVAEILQGGKELAPTTPAGGVVDQESMKRLLADNDWQFVPADAVGDPVGRGWTEGGDIDQLGHGLGSKITHHLPDQVRQLTLRVAELVNAGWKRVVVVTDHGWLMLPGKLPKHHLPEHLTVVRKGRCARLADAVERPAETPVLPWRWDSTVQIALAPGIHAFEAGKAYEHGGLSPQECVVPRIVVTKHASSTPFAPKIDYNWVGLTLKVEVLDAPEGCRVDIRSKANDGSTSLATAPKVLKDGKARIVVEDEYQGQAGVIVITSPEDALLANTATVIPES